MASKGRPQHGSIKEWVHQTGDVKQVPWSLLHFHLRILKACRRRCLRRHRHSFALRPPPPLLPLIVPQAQLQPFLLIQEPTLPVSIHFSIELYSTNALSSSAFLLSEPATEPLKIKISSTRMVGDSSVIFLFLSQLILIRFELI